MDGIRAVVKRYENPEKKLDFCEYIYFPTDHNKIYERMMQLTGNNHEVSDEAACWCELATVGETYEFCQGEIEIQDID